MKIVIITLFVFATSCFSFSSANNDYTNEENNENESVCGFFEPLMFLAFRSSAGAPLDVEDFIDETKKELELTGLDVEKAEEIDIGDNDYLRGYKLSSNKKKNKGYLLVIQGNAMLADHILTDFKDYAKEGYDVYIYDFRDYGLSDGDSRLKSIVKDYDEKIITKLNNKYRNKKHLLYGMSFGGIVLLKALKDKDISDNNMRVVIDSVPSEITFCRDTTYNPINNLPTKNINNFMFFVGVKDSIVEIEEDFINKIEEYSIKVEKKDECGHPYQIEECEPLRFNIVRDYLTGDKK